MPAMLPFRRLTAQMLFGRDPSDFEGFLDRAKAAETSAASSRDPWLREFLLMTAGEWRRMAERTPSPTRDGGELFD
jgi:hypothetical protein